MIEHRIDLLEAILDPWRESLGPDYAGYRNHVYRMLHFCFRLRPPDTVSREKLIIAGAFHDLGIWAAGTLDYLAPSVSLSEDYLQSRDLDSWREEIGLMIRMHHKIRAYKVSRFPLVELFRQGDLVDFTLGWVKFGIPKSDIDSVKRAFPNAGFHKRLKTLAWSRLKSHPANPFPMMKW